jgi:hypothetical protein
MKYISGACRKNPSSDPRYVKWLNSLPVDLSSSMDWFLTYDLPDLDQKVELSHLTSSDIAIK